MLAAAAVYFFATYRDYTGIYANTCGKRTSTSTIALHHDDVPRETSVDQVQYQHYVENKWESGFAYHIYLMDGHIYQMHQLDDATIHAYGAKYNSVAVCVHEPDKYKPRTRANLFLTLLFLKLYYGLEAASIKGHGELPGNLTTCPDMDMDSVRNCFIDISFQQTLKPQILRK